MALAVIFLIDLHFNFLPDWNKKSRSKASVLFSFADRGDKKQVLTILENLRSLYGASFGSTFPRMMPLVPGIAPTNLPFIFRDPKDSEKSQMGPTGISASPQKASASRPSGRFPWQVPEASGDDTKPPSRGWGHTSTSPSNVAPPPPPHPCPWGANPFPQSPAPEVRVSIP